MNGLQNYITSGMIQGLGGGFDDGLYGGLQGEKKLQINKTGLVVYYDFSNPLCYFEGSSVINNLVRPQGRGRFIGTVPTFSRLTKGTVILTYTTASSCITVPNFPELNSTTSSVSIWLRYNSAFINDRVPFIKGTSLGAGFSNYWYEQTANLGYAYDTLTGMINISSSVLTQNVWHNLVSVYDGVNMLFYLNGALRGSFAKAVVNTNTADIGINGEPNTAFFATPNKSYGMFMYYNRAISASEIRYNYDIQKINFI